MADTTRVVLYGGSLYMAGLAVSLQADPALEVVHVLSGAAGIEQVLQSAATAAVVFELEEIPCGLVVDYIGTYPGLLAIGMDPASDQALLLSGQHVRVGTMNDMIRLLRGALSDDLCLSSKDAAAAARGDT